jgi:type IV pilus assembly protein PilQ
MMDGFKPLRRAKVALLTALGAGLITLASTSSWAQGAPNHVRDVKLHTTEGVAGAAEIEVHGTGSPVYRLRVADGGKRILLELSNADVTGAPAALTTPAGVVGGVLTQSYPMDGGTMTRVTVSLLKNASYRIQVDGSVLKLQLTPSETTGPAQGAPPPSSVAKAEGEDASAEIKDVKLERVPAGKDGCLAGCERVVVALTGVPPYSLVPAANGKLRLELKKTKLPESLTKTFDSAQLRGTIRSVSTSYDAKSDATTVEIDRAGDASGIVMLDGKTLSWTFEAPKTSATATAPAQAAPKANTRKSVTVAREELPPDTPKIETSIVDLKQSEAKDAKPAEIKVETSDGQQAGFASSVNAQAAGRYTGRRIDLDLKDADIHNILRLLADVGRVNIVTADDVSGNITIRMRNVPWDQALDVVLQAKGLGMVRSGNLIRVAPQAVLQKEREAAIARAKQELELTPLETRLIPVSYAQADELQARAKDLLSPRGSLAVDERTNVLIARDVPGNLNHIEELVRSLDTQTPQVLVEARIVEATSRYIRDIGIQWGGDATFSEATGNPTGVAFPSKLSLAGGAYDQNTPTAGVSPFQRVVPTPNFAVNLPAAVGTGQGGAMGFSFGSVDNNFNLGLRLSAAEASGMLRIVSAPRILTLDNRDARINQGTLIPFSQISAQGVQTTFQEAKLQLLVKPHVTADGSISMHVKINRDEPDFNQTSARGDPTILKREAETDLLVMDGHTAVIGGIFTRNTGRNLDQVPFFGDIPILGILFQRRRASDTRNELVIFLTPRIVNRAEALGR